MHSTCPHARAPPRAIAQPLRVACAMLRIEDMKPILLIAFLGLVPALADQLSPPPAAAAVAAAAGRQAGAGALTPELSRERAELCGR